MKKFTLIIYLFSFYIHFMHAGYQESLKKGFQTCKECVINNFEKDKLPIMPPLKIALPVGIGLLGITISDALYNKINSSYAQKKEFYSHYPDKQNARPLWKMAKKAHKQARPEFKDGKKILLLKKNLLLAPAISEPFLYMSKIKSSNTFYEQFKYIYLTCSTASLLNNILLNQSFVAKVWLAPGLLYAGSNRFYHAYNAYQNNNKIECAGNLAIGTSLFVILGLVIKATFEK